MATLESVTQRENISSPPKFFLRAPTKAPSQATYLPTFRKGGGNLHNKYNKKYTPTTSSLPVHSRQARAHSPPLPHGPAPAPSSPHSCSPCAFQAVGLARPLHLILYNHASPARTCRHFHRATARSTSPQSCAPLRLASSRPRARRRTPGAAPCTRVGALPATPGRPAKSTPQEQPSNWPQSPLHPALTRG